MVGKTLERFAKDRRGEGVGWTLVALLVGAAVLAYIAWQFATKANNVATTAQTKAQTMLNNIR